MLNSEFIKLFGDKAVSRYKQTKILPSLCICQAIQESGWGKTDLAVKANNYHGIKWYNDSIAGGYPAVNYKTFEEYKKGEITDVECLFCKFKDVDEELECYFNWILKRDYNQYYKAIPNETNAYKVFDLIDKSPYATDSGYGRHLKRIYDQYPEIKSYDDEVLQKKAIYRVQIGSFTDKQNAVNYANEAKSKGFPVLIKKHSVYYRVQIGAYEVRSNAEAQRIKAISAGYAGAYITTEGGEDIGV